MKYFAKIPKDILYQPKQSINSNKKLQPTTTLNMTLQKLAGKANSYVQFGYVPQTIFNNNRGQV